MPTGRSISVTLLLLVLAAGPADAAPRRSPASAAPTPSAPPASGTAPAAADAGRPEPGPGPLGLLGMAAGLAAALVGAAWALRRWPPAARWLGRVGAVRVVARTPLGQRHALCLVEAFGLGVLLALQEAGLSVPHHISVVGHDDIPMAQWLIPPLSTIRIDYAILGEKAVESLVHLLQKEKSDTEPVQTVATRFVVRQSTTKITQQEA